MQHSTRRFALALGAMITMGCAEREPAEGRGAGLDDARIAAAEQAHSYGAALRTAFDLGPGLSLLLDPATLPRGTGNAPGPVVPDSVRHALLADGAIQGTCEPQVSRETHAPICAAAIPGYVVRVSDVYELGKDSLQLHVLVRRYDTPATAPHQAFAFEEAYQLARRECEWRVVRKARLERAD